MKTLYDTEYKDCMIQNIPLNTITRMHCVNHRTQRNKGKSLFHKMFIGTTIIL